MFLSLDLALDITGQHHGRSPGLFFMTLIFPAASAIAYLILAAILVFRRLDEYQSLGKCSSVVEAKDSNGNLIHLVLVLDPIVYVALTMMAFGASQALLFAASPIIERMSNRHINASVFSVLLDLVAVSCVYKFWNSITDGKHMLLD